MYETGGTVVISGLTNRIAVTKKLTIQSVNGPTVTVIRGYQVPGTTNGDEAVRCAYLGSGAVLSGFTLTNGATRNSGDVHGQQSGGGIFCDGYNVLVTTCVIIGNAASQYGGVLAPSTVPVSPLATVYWRAIALGCTAVVLVTLGWSVAL